MSPVLKAVRIDEIRAIVVDQGATLDFGKIKELRYLEL